MLTLLISNTKIFSAFCGKAELYNSILSDLVNVVRSITGKIIGAGTQKFFSEPPSRAY